MVSLANIATAVSANTDTENFDLAAEWAVSRFGQDVKIHLIAQYRHHADTMIRVEGRRADGRHFMDEVYLSQLI